MTSLITSSITLRLISRTNKFHETNRETSEKYELRTQISVSSPIVYGVRLPSVLDFCTNFIIFEKS